MPIAWAWVSAMQADDPVLVIYPGGVDRMPWENMVLVSIEEKQHRPLMADLAFKGRDHVTSWTAVGAQDPMRKRLAPYREHYQAKARGEYKALPS